MLDLSPTCGPATATSTCSVLCVSGESVWPDLKPHALAQNGFASPRHFHVERLICRGREAAHSFCSALALAYEVAALCAGTAGTDGIPQPHLPLSARECQQAPAKPGLYGEPCRIRGGVPPPSGPMPPGCWATGARTER
jgi:hypothetical protein